jgi:hypothetical protein
MGFLKKRKLFGVNWKSGTEQQTRKKVRTNSFCRVLRSRGVISEKCFHGFFVSP